MFLSILKRKRNIRFALNLLTGAALFFVCQTAATEAQQNPGNLDTSFNGNGKIIAAFDNPDNVAGAVAVQPDGKIVVAGLTGTIDTFSKTPGSSNFLVLRYNADGSLDSTFDMDGKVVTSFGNGEDGAGAVLIQPDGKIIAAGSSETARSTDNFNLAVVRYFGDNIVARSADFDFDGDGKSDPAVFRPGAQAQWFFLRSGANNAFSAVQWGSTNDALTPADFDGDGKTDVAVWRSNAENPERAYFYILNSSNNAFRAEQFGSQGDLPNVVGDWDGDGKADPAVFRPRANAGGTQSAFYYRPSSAPGVDFRTVLFGSVGDIPMRGDFDGDGKSDAAVFRGSDNLWYILQSSNNQLVTRQWGIAADKKFPADYDGDGKTDLAVLRSGVWCILQSSNNQPRYLNWGTPSDAIIPSDYDGDGKTDVAVYRSGVWYINQSSNGQLRAFQFGAPTDLPVQTTRFFNFID